MTLFSTKEFSHNPQTGSPPVDGYGLSALRPLPCALQRTTSGNALPCFTVHTCSTDAPSCRWPLPLLP